MPEDEARRQAIVEKLDFFDGSLPSPSATGTPTPTSLSLVDNAMLQAIVEKCCETFGVSIALLSVLDDQRHRYLASKGLPEGVTELPRSTTFCTHTILNEGRGLVVLNAKEDWRFKNGLLAVALGARFYAGAPPRLPVRKALN